MEIEWVINFLNYLIIFIIGSCFGSFANALTYRIHNNLNWLNDRSKCVHCKKDIYWYDNLPIISYLILKGRCRYCKFKIPFDYFVIELLSGLLPCFYFFFLKYYNNFNIYFFLFLSIFSWVCLVLILSDLKYLELPSVFIYFLIFLAALYRFILNFDVLVSNVFVFLFDLFLSFSFPFLFFGLQYFFTKNKGIGEGDIFLGIAIGTLLDFLSTVNVILITYVIGSLILLLLLALKKVNAKTKVPLGSFLLIVLLIWFVSSTMFDYKFEIIKFIANF